MHMGMIPLLLLFITVIGVVGIVLYRTIWCRLFRHPTNDRREAELDFEGRDRRRGNRTGTAADRKDTVPTP
jgi:hypothetical protein